MKLAPICPPHLIPGVRELEFIGGYSFCLAQYVYADRRYEQHHRDQRRRPAHFTIIDNGAAEYEPLTFEQLLVAAEKINASEVVMPDVLRDYNQTIALTTAACESNKVPVNKRMVVPQGENWGEWEHCLTWFADNLSFATIGVPKHLERLQGGRAYALKLITGWGLHQKYRIHMLGVYDRPFLEVAEALRVYPYIRGIDTGAPVAWAQHDVVISDMPPHHSLDWELPANWQLIAGNVSSYRSYIMEVARVEHAQAEASRSSM